MDHPSLRTVVRRVDGWHSRRDGTWRPFLRWRPKLSRGRRQARPSLRNNWRCAGSTDGHTVRQHARPDLTLRISVSAMSIKSGIEIYYPRFAHYVLENAPLEVLASGFRWIEGLVWMGDAGCLLFQDLPCDRTMRWIEAAGVSVYRAPSGYANGQTRDRQGRLIYCSHRERCLFSTELDGV